MRRSLSRVLCLAGGLLAAGCADHGSYRFFWTFADGEADVGCGQHGVDSIRVTGMNQEGDSEDATALCTAGEFAHSVPVGSWMLTIHQIDVRGRPILLTDAQGQLLPDPTATADVATDAETLLQTDPVVLGVRPACSDGVDNDGDGKVDLDDLDAPECVASSNAAAE